MATKNIEPNLRLISEYTKLGKDDKFRIPEYQRGYKGSRYGMALDLSKYPKDKWGKKDIEDATATVAERIAKFIFKK